MTLRAALLFAALLAGCASTPKAPTAPAVIDYSVVCEQLELRGGGTPALRWTKNSAEHRVLFERTFADVLRRVSTAAKGRPAGSWAVVVDADETLLDNTASECADQLLGFTEFDPNRWTRWVLAEASKATPGAQAFAAEIRKRGGRLIIVSNREEAMHRAATESNLKKLGIAYDALILAKSDRELDKNQRFRTLEDVGLPEIKLPRRSVLAYVGDNIKDFPFTSQIDVGELDAFGTRFFLLPNPMYGSWQRIPLR